METSVVETGAQRPARPGGRRTRAPRSTASSIAARRQAEPRTAQASGPGSVTVEPLLGERSSDDARGLTVLARIGDRARAPRREGYWWRRLRCSNRSSEVRSKISSARSSNQPEATSPAGASNSGTYGFRSSTGVPSRRSSPATTRPRRRRRRCGRARSRSGSAGAASASRRPRAAGRRGTGRRVGAQPTDSCRCAITQTCENPSRSARHPRCGSLRTIRDGPVVSAAGCSGIPSSAAWAEETTPIASILHGLSAAFVEHRLDEGAGRAGRGQPPDRDRAVEPLGVGDPLHERALAALEVGELGPQERGRAPAPARSRRRSFSSSSERRSRTCCHRPSEPAAERRAAAPRGSQHRALRAGRARRGTPLLDVAELPQHRDGAIDERPRHRPHRPDRRRPGANARAMSQPCAGPSQRSPSTAHS